MWYHLGMKEPRQPLGGISREHIGKWVALAEDRKTVLASSEDLVELYGKVKDESATYTKVLDPDKAYAF